MGAYFSAFSQVFGFGLLVVVGFGWIFLPSVKHARRGWYMLRKSHTVSSLKLGFFLVKATLFLMQSGYHDPKSHHSQAAGKYHLFLVPCQKPPLITMTAADGTECK